MVSAPALYCDRSACISTKALKARKMRTTLNVMSRSRLCSVSSSRESSAIKELFWIRACRGGEEG